MYVCEHGLYLYVFALVRVHVCVCVGGGGGGCVYVHVCVCVSDWGGGEIECVCVYHTSSVSVMSLGSVCHSSCVCVPFLLCLCVIPAGSF